MMVYLLINWSNSHNRVYRNNMIVILLVRSNKKQSPCQYSFNHMALCKLNERQPHITDLVTNYLKHPCELTLKNVLAWFHFNTIYIT